MKMIVLEMDAAAKASQIAAEEQKNLNCKKM
jgi:hypothetical protein